MAESAGEWGGPPEGLRFTLYDEGGPESGDRPEGGAGPRRYAGGGARARFQESGQPGDALEAEQPSRRGSEVDDLGDERDTHVPFDGEDRDTSGG